MSQDIEAAKALLERYRRLGTWRAVAGEMHINAGLLHQVAHLKTASSRVRAALGLPARHVRVLPCPCGQVHQGMCTNGRRLARRVRSSEPEFLRAIQEIAAPWLSGNDREGRP